MSKSVLFVLLLAIFIRGSFQEKVDQLIQNTTEAAETETDKDGKEIPVVKLPSEAKANYRISSPSEFLDAYGEVYMNSSFIWSLEKFIDLENPSLENLINITFAERFIKSFRNISKWVIVDGEGLDDFMNVETDLIHGGPNNRKKSKSVYINGEYQMIRYLRFYNTTHISYAVRNTMVKAHFNSLIFLPEGFKRDFEIKFAMVTHHSLHKAFVALEDNCLTDSQKAESAEKKLRHSLEALVNEANEVFEKLGGESGEFRVTPIKTVITQNVEELSCFEKGRIDNVTVDGNRALSHCFKAIIDVNPLNLPSVDVVIIFTRDNLWFRNNLTKCVAFSETMCIIENMVFVQYDDFSSAVKATVQGLAVTLDIKFDGDRHDNEHCKHEDNYIMAKDFTQTWGNENLFSFSSCAVMEADKWIIWLERKVKNNCLDKNKGKNKPDKQDKMLYLLAGEIQNLHDQCVFIVGPESYYCGNENATTEGVVCKSIRCYANGGCWSMPKFVLDGTSCDDGKWCRRGQCIWGDRAPELFQLPTLKSEKCDEDSTAGPETETETEAGIPAKDEWYRSTTTAGQL